MRLPVTSSFKALSSRKSTFVSILDIGTSKIVCLIAELKPAAETLPSLKRTHSIRLLGIGHHRAAGVKGGAIVDLEAAELAIRNAIDAAENMSKVEIKSVLVTLTGGDLTSHSVSTHETLHKGVATSADVQKVLAQAEYPWAKTPEEMLLHIFPTDFTLDSQSNIANPIGMVGSTLSVNSHIITADSVAARNLILAVERCHVDVEAIVATPYAAGLSTLLDDEMTPGSIVLDMGGGTTSLGVFVGGRCMHVDSIPIGGERVTADITHGLSIGFSAAERLKTLYGSAISSESDMRESLVVRRSSEDGDEGTQYIQRSELVRIIRPRIEEIFEIIGSRITALGCSLTTGWSLILTGGASQLSGVAEVAARILAPEKRILIPDGSYAIVGGARVRIGRPLGVRGLIEEAKGPAFAASVGMLVYPQVLHKEYKEDKASLLLNTYMGKEERMLSRVGRWIRENF